jgi:hypothetical protein
MAETCEKCGHGTPMTVEVLPSYDVCEECGAPWPLSPRAAPATSLDVFEAVAAREMTPEQGAAILTGAAPATGPRVESSPIDLSEIPTAAEVALNPPRFEFEPAAPPPPEPAEERSDSADDPEALLRVTRSQRDTAETALRAERTTVSFLRECLVAAADHLDGLGARMAADRARAEASPDRTFTAASAPLPRPEESALPEIERLMDALVSAAYRHGHADAHEETTPAEREAAPMPVEAARAALLRALFAPPPGEERLRERIEALAVEWECQIANAPRDAGYVDSQGRGHLYGAEARLVQQHSDALRTALREDEKGATP